MPRTPEDVIQEELESPEKLMYLSFAGDEGFLGAVIVSANGIATASVKCWQMGCNPGGEVMASVIMEPAASTITVDLKNRLLSREELERAFGPCASTSEFKCHC